MKGEQRTASGVAGAAEDFRTRRASLAAKGHGNGCKERWFARVATLALAGTDIVPAASADYGDICLRATKTSMAYSTSECQKGTASGSSPTSASRRSQSPRENRPRSGGEVFARHIP